MRRARRGGRAETRAARRTAAGGRAAGPSGPRPCRAQAYPTSRGGRDRGWAAATRPLCAAPARRPASAGWSHWATPTDTAATAAAHAALAATSLGIHLLQHARHSARRVPDRPAGTPPRPRAASAGTDSAGPRRRPAPANLPRRGVGQPRLGGRAEQPLYSRRASRAVGCRGRPPPCWDADRAPSSSRTGSAATGLPASCANWKSSLSRKAEIADALGHQILHHGVAPHFAQAAAAAVRMPRQEPVPAPFVPEHGILRRVCHTAAWRSPPGTDRRAALGQGGFGGCQAVRVDDPDAQAGREPRPQPLGSRSAAGVAGSRRPCMAPAHPVAQVPWCRASRCSRTRRTGDSAARAAAVRPGPRIWSPPCRSGRRPGCPSAARSRAGSLRRRSRRERSTRPAVRAGPPRSTTRAPGRQPPPPARRARGATAARSAGQSVRSASCRRVSK